MAARRGIGVTRKQVLMRTSVLCKRLRIGSGYPNFVAGKDCWEGIRRRHPDLTIRKPEKLSSTRARMMNREVIGRYFNDLGTIIEELNLLDKPQNLWNCDEMGKSFEHDPVRVVSQKGVNCVTRTSSRSTNITVMACVNANGKRLPPMFVVKGKSSKSLHGFNTENAPAGSRWFYQKNGWMDDQIGEHWFLDVFLKCCGPDRPQLLILDGHSSHETLAFLQCAMENIHLLALPPHTTHYLQPLDRAVFGPLNREYNKACSSFLQENALHQINKWTFPSLFKVAWDSAVVQANIKSGFRACGIFPFNRNAIPDSAFAPSEPTNVPIPEAEVNLHHSLKGGSILAVADSPVNQTGKNEGNHDEVTSSITEKPRTHVVEGLPDTGIFEPVVLQDSSYSLTGSVLDISDPEQLFTLIESGELLCQPLVDENGCILVEPLVQTQNVDKEIEDMFIRPAQRESKQVNKPRKTVTTHRLLTSEDIIKEKLKAEEKKLEKEMKKKQNELKRENKNALKFSSKKIKREKQ